MRDPYFVLFVLFESRVNKGEKTDKFPLLVSFVKLFFRGTNSIPDAVYDFKKDKNKIN